MCVCVCLFLLHYSAPAVGGLCFWFLFPCSFDSTVHSIVVSWVCVCVDMLLCVCAHVWVSPQPLHLHAHSALFCKKSKTNFLMWLGFPPKNFFCLPKALGVTSCTSSGQSWSNYVGHYHADTLKVAWLSTIFIMLLNIQYGPLFSILLD